MQQNQQKQQQVDNINSTTTPDIITTASISNNNNNNNINNNNTGDNDYVGLMSIFNQSDDRQLFGNMIFDCVTGGARQQNSHDTGAYYGNSTYSQQPQQSQPSQQPQQQQMYSQSDFDDLHMSFCNTGNDMLLLPHQQQQQYVAQQSLHYYPTNSSTPCAYGSGAGGQQSLQDQQQQQQQQQHVYQQDYTNIDNLEPSLVPGQMDQQQQQQQPGGHLQQQHVMTSSMGGYGSASTGAYYQTYHHHSSPTGSSHTSSGTDLSEESDEMFGFASYKRSSSINETEFCRNVKGKRQGKKRKPKRDPNEPQKPVSAYALFFRDTQATIKGQNPNASFGEVSKIVASMWDSLDFESKNVYKQKTESAKKDYLKQLAAYRANLLSKTSGLQGGSNQSMMDPFSELTQQQRKLSSLQSSQANIPDSTTMAVNERKDACAELSGKTLATLIAEPAPQQVLTATTTLTVPQAYVPTRGKVEYEQDTVDLMNGNMCVRSGCNKHSINSSHWDREYCTDECVVKHCRDAFTGWVQNRQQSEPGTYAPV